MSQSQKPLGAYLMRNIKSHFCVFIFAGFFAFLNFFEFFFFRIFKVNYVVGNKCTGAF